MKMATRVGPALVILAALWAGAASAGATEAKAQTTAPAAGAPAQTSTGDAADAQAAQDHIMALVRSGKCGAAHGEAVRIGDASLADQISAMCGAKAADPFAKPSRSGGRKGPRGG